MFYKFDKNNLVFKRDWKCIKMFTLIIFGVFVSSFILGRYVKHKSIDKFEKELMILNLKQEKDKFTKEKLIDEIKRLNIKFPHIVMAQSIVETGHWNSKIFKENHNLFGLRQAVIRINTANGTQYNHAYYDNWKESLYDYAFYSCRYLSNISSEEEYFQYLQKNYAESPDYVTALKNTIKRENLKLIFN